MGAYVEVAHLDHVQPGTGTLVAVGDRAAALFNVDGHMFAIEDTCVRCGSSLASGAVHDHDVVCSGCHWRYDIRTGCVSGVPALCIDTFEVEVVDSRVMVATTATSGCRKT
ncbi:MAG TPA: nitrite reductase (NAD(P)H) small subunit [Casimicrobiaceae bacterium]|nr:nitrite reductase (NAD(P)H) small subunit [Casimicrobiaceae bacterium]